MHSRGEQKTRLSTPGIFVLPTFVFGHNFIAVAIAIFMMEVGVIHSLIAVAIVIAIFSNKANG